MQERSTGAKVYQVEVGLGNEDYLQLVENVGEIAIVCQERNWRSS
jgi:hypothetical protein